MSYSLAGDALVRGSVTLARALGIPSLVIGLTIIAFGTSAPELVISLCSALDGVSGIAVGNVVGSNIANVLLVLGIPALIATTHCTERSVRKNSALLVAVSVIFTAMCTFGTLNRAMGIVLLALLGLFLFDSYREMRRHQCRRREYREGNSDNLDEDQIAELEEFEESPGGYLVAVDFMIVGLIGLPLGGHFAVIGAFEIARSWGVTDTAIGLTVIALGTSLPELATTVMATLRGHSAVALGNVLESNVFNIVAILGLTAVIVPLDVLPAIMRYDIWVMMATTLLLAIFAFTRCRLRWPLGLALVAGYCLYIFMIFAAGKVA
ncbi:calcium/sodium antiporter [Breoghania sp.]|uniref:calcium/sodium antiporter n=1 Tax=Breoghania sp. TaxID=2065378 RepID=UPI00262A94A3|nr:calcium/sodium antiporter [Breoghania sp.]MDJ0931547.1 calcium/sodium antiporter [Breoghania sp.]